MAETRYFLTPEGRKAIAECERDYMGVLDEAIIKFLKELDSGK